MHEPTETGSLTADAAAARSAGDSATVGVVITTYNHAHFLDDALTSVVNQTVAADRVIVVDDGSTDDPASVVSRFPGAALIQQNNQGLSAARNAGLAALDTRYVTFLDADDRLEPRAIETALACFARAPECGFVYGGHRYINRDGELLGQRYEPAGDDAFVRLLRRNFIAMHGTVMYRRECLVDAGAFDPSLKRCEDYDVYLRMARRYSIASYADLVASYRLHDANMSSDYQAMLRTALDVHARHRPGHDEDAEVKRAWRDGRRSWRRNYAIEMALARYRYRRSGATLAQSLPKLARLALVSPGTAVNEAVHGVRHRLEKILPGRIQNRIPRLLGHTPGVGGIRLGDLDRNTPISGDFGFDRGTPIDRYYIERFLERHASEIVGRVLEVGDDSYTRRFGATRVTQADVLHVHAGNPRATFVGDLTDAAVLPENTFDCIVLTQTLQLIYDVRLAVSRLHRALAPGGVVLVTVPGISQIDRGEWGASWYWSFTRTALERLFAEVFGRDEVLVEHHGNVFAATAFLHGLALEEIDRRKLDPFDMAYPVIVAVRARKRRS
ncbi:MAG TPA: glycosyltransferase [Vicinamibacterales bacterium]|nr:glycosyltransferase [Vicinamibacterales bacterium]